MYNSTNLTDAVGLGGHNEAKYIDNSRSVYQKFEICVQRMVLESKIAFRLKQVKIRIYDFLGATCSGMTRI